MIGLFIPTLSNGKLVIITAIYCAFFVLGITRAMKLDEIVGHETRIYSDKALNQLKILSLAFCDEYCGTVKPKTLQRF